MTRRSTNPLFHRAPKGSPQQQPQPRTGASEGFASAPNPVSDVDAGEELALGLAADRLERARRAEWLQRRWNRARSLETWGGRLLNAGGITFYVLFPLLILADPLFDIDVSARTWLLVFGADFTAILVGGFLVFLTRRIQNWLRRWAEANFVEV